MKNLMRNLTMSAAALAALVAAPKTFADAPRRAEAREARPFRGGERSPRGDTSRGQAGRREGYRGEAFRGDSGHREAFRGEGYRGRESGTREWRGQEWRGRSFFRSPARVSGRGYVAPFRVYAGSRFFSYCPGPGYFYVSDLGWAFPLFPGAVWVPAHYDFDGFFIEGGWQ